MNEELFLGESNYFRLAILDLKKILPVRAEYRGRRFWAYFPKSKAEEVLADYEAGSLRVVARDFVASIQRTRALNAH